jgi:hypothetical protein
MTTSPVAAARSHLVVQTLLAQHLIFTDDLMQALVGILGIHIPAWSGSWAIM